MGWLPIGVQSWNVAAAPTPAIFGPRGGARVMADSTKQQLAAERSLAPVARNIDRHPPYLRIATEEAWNIPEILAAQVRLLGSADAPDDSSLRMAGMFSRMTALQEQLMDIGPARLARMDELGIDKQLLLLTSPGVQVLEPRRGHRAGAAGQRPAGRGLPAPPGSLSRA